MRKRCRWYDQTSGMKRAYDKGLIDHAWINDYYMNNGTNCVRKERFENEGYVSPDYILPDGNEDPKLKQIIMDRSHF